MLQWCHCLDFIFQCVIAMIAWDDKVTWLGLTWQGYIKIGVDTVDETMTSCKMWGYSIGVQYLQVSVRECEMEYADVECINRRW